MDQPKDIPATVQIIMDDFLSALKQVQSLTINGLYLTGSVALNDYHLGKSDIDFVVLCEQLPTIDTQHQLKNIHNTIERKYEHSNLSGIYITMVSLDSGVAVKTKVISYYERRIEEIFFKMAEITLLELKETAITLFGIPANKLPIQVDIAVVNNFLSQNINTYWKEWMRKPWYTNPKAGLLIMFPRLSEWLVLGVARQLYTLRTARIISKTGAGYYCLEQLPVVYHPIIKAAVATRLENKRHLLALKDSYYIKPSLKRWKDTIACADFIIDLFNREKEG